LPVASDDERLSAVQPSALSFQKSGHEFAADFHG
jgi:hypothetical protein